MVNALYIKGSKLDVKRGSKEKINKKGEKSVSCYICPGKFKIYQELAKEQELEDWRFHQPAFHNVQVRNM